MEKPENVSEVPLLSEEDEEIFYPNSMKEDVASFSQPDIHNTNKYKDAVYGLCFLAHLVLIFTLAVTTGLSHIADFQLTFAGQIDEKINSSHTKISNGQTLFFIFACSALLGLLLSLGWLFLVQNYSNFLIVGTIKTSVILFSVLAIGHLGYYLTGSGAELDDQQTSLVSFCFYFLSAALTAFYYFTVRHRIPFAAANLAVAVRIVRRFPLVIYSAYVALIIQVLWVLIWGIATIGVWSTASKKYEGSHGGAIFSVFLMLTSLFWGLQVIKNVVLSVAAGSVGTWWHHKPALDSRNKSASESGLYMSINPTLVVNRSIKRSLTTSFGSICLASLVIAVLQAVRTLIREKNRISSSNSRTSTNACLDCIVTCILQNAQYFNKFALCQVALYGQGLKKSGYVVMSLFKARGWTLIVNDSLINGVLSTGNLVVGGITGLFGSQWIHSSLICSDVESLRYPGKCESFGAIFVTFCICLTIGYAMCAIISSVVESVVATMFICFAQDPTSLSNSNPEEFRMIMHAWQTHHPEALLCIDEDPAASIHV